MTPEELRNRIAVLGLDTSDAARILGVEPRTMRRWLTGEKDITRPVIILLNLIEAVPGVQEWLHNNRDTNI